MPAAKPMSMRRALINRHQAGESLAAIARDLEMAYNTARNLWRQYCQTGDLTPRYGNGRRPQVRKERAVYALAVQLKQRHPGWGAGLIRLELADRFAATQLPCERSLQRWFRAAGVAAARPTRQPKPSVQRGQAVHEVWAMDAKEQIALADGSYVSWLAMTDEASGAVLEAVLFPPASLDPDRPVAGQAGAASGDDRLGASPTAAGG